MLKVDFVQEAVLARLLDFIYKGYLEVHGVDLQQLLLGAQMLRYCLMLFFGELFFFFFFF